MYVYIVATAGVITIIRQRERSISDYVLARKRQQDLYID